MEIGSFILGVLIIIGVIVGAYAIGKAFSKGWHNEKFKYLDKVIKSTCEGEGKSDVR